MAHDRQKLCEYNAITIQWPKSCIKPPREAQESKFCSSTSEADRVRYPAHYLPSLHPTASTANMRSSLLVLITSYLALTQAAPVAIAEPQDDPKPTPALPSSFPTTWPSGISKPTAFPTAWPSGIPKPTAFPTAWPSGIPKPTALPTAWPSGLPKPSGKPVVPRAAEEELAPPKPSKPTGLKPSKPAGRHAGHSHGPRPTKFTKPAGPKPTKPAGPMPPRPSGVKLSAGSPKPPMPSGIKPTLLAKPSGKPLIPRDEVVSLKPSKPIKSTGPKPTKKPTGPKPSKPSDGHAGHSHGAMPKKKPSGPKPSGAPKPKST